MRLDDRELALVVAALRARMAGVGAATSAEIDKLATRLSEGKRGNPVWIFQWQELASEMGLNDGN